MRRRVGLALALVLGAACNRIAIDAPPPGPSLLLVTIDTLRADHVGAYGAREARTPTLDTLAARGVRFATAIAPAPLTLPSHASLFTGLLPPRHGIRHNAMFHLADSADTLAQQLQRSGYATAAVVGAVVLARDAGLARGFAHYDDRMGPRRSATAGYAERRAEDVSEGAIAWLRGNRGPFFLWAHYFDPHADYDPPAPYAKSFPSRPYDGEIAYVDAMLARLLAELEAQERLADTLIVVTSDHGESLGEHGEATHGYTLYDATLAVPLLIAGAGVPEGAIVREVVSLADVLPTVLPLLGLPTPDALDGRNLAPLWGAAAGRSTEAGSERVAYAESLATQLDHGWSPLHALRSQRFLYVQAPRPELYDVKADPAQVRDLLADGSDLARKQAQPLEARLRTMLAEASPATPASVAPETRERLRALGYAIPDGPVPYSGMDPKDGMRWAAGFERAVEDYLSGELERPRRFLEAMLDETPTSALGHGLLAAVRLAEGDARGAAPHAEAAARLAPRSADHAALLGDVRRTLGDVAGALEAYRNASRLEPHRIEPWLAILTLEHARGNLAEAERAAARAVEARPNDPERWTAVGAAWDRLIEPQRALAALERALALDPEHERAHALAALQQLRLGEARKAERHLKAAPRWRDDPVFLHRLAVAHAAHGDARRAEQIFRNLIARDPQAPGPRRNLATLLRQQGRDQEARELLD